MRVDFTETEIEVFKLAVIYEMKEVKEVKADNDGIPYFINILSKIENALEKKK